MTATPEPAEPATETQAPGEQEHLYRDLVVVGASAGGVEALERLVRGLPPELPASVFVVLHLLSTGTSVLDSILARSGPLPASVAVDGERFERGHIYVAPPDQHLLLREDQIQLSLGPRENGHRPAVDPLFRSAARTFGPRVIAVVLSGSLDDGAAGARFVKERGGAAIVQEPRDALYSAMPSSAIAATEVDRTAPADEIAGAVCDLLEQPLDRALEDEAEGMWSAPELEERAVGDPSGPYLPRVRRRAVGARRGLTCALRLPHRPCVLARQPGRGAVQGPGERALVGAARPRGARRPVPAHGQSGRGQHDHGPAVRLARPLRGSARGGGARSDRQAGTRGCGGAEPETEPAA